MTDITKIKITNDPYTGPRAKTVGKYHALFESLKIGQCLVLPVGVSVQSVQAALAKHVKRNGINAVVRMRSKCEDGKARVWLLEAKPKFGLVKTRWATHDGKPPRAKEAA